MTERVIFSATFESLFRAAGADAVQAALPTMRAEGIDPLHLNPAYPMTTWVRVVRALLPAFAPGLEAEVALDRLGERVVDSYGEGLVGKALFGVLKVLGPRRALERTTRNFRTTNNYAESTVTHLEGNTFELWMNEVDLPGFSAAVVRAGLRHAGAVDPVVTVKRQDDKGTTFHVSWR
ncbi:MAG: DUF2378 family protein [Myxococcaceae bacterium]|jgi:uncharacterized protein (TIGR02265 family)|nr:DUF2378 family protein [Myxococcaceae bacterium]